MRVSRPISGRAWLLHAAVVTLIYAVVSTVQALIISPGTSHWLPTLGLAVLAGLPAGVGLGPLAGRLAIPVIQRAAILFIFVYGLLSLTNGVEALMFVKGTNPLLLLEGILPALALALPVTVLFPPAEIRSSLGFALARALRGRPWWSWAWRGIVTALLWVPVYFFFAALDAPFVHSYYVGPNSQFHVPATNVVLTAELIRGGLHVLLLFPLLALLGGVRRSAAAWLPLAFFLLNAWIPLVQQTAWPVFVRAANIVEIAGDALVFTLLLVPLLGWNRSVTRSAPVSLPTGEPVGRT